MRLAYVYKWTHLPTLNWYVGSRTSKHAHPDDGYICSSKTVKASILSNVDDWRKEIIATGTAEEMYELESEILQTTDARNDPRSYNKHNNDFESSSYTNATKNWQSPEYAKKHKAGLQAYSNSEAGKKELSNRTIKMWENDEYRKKQNVGRVKRYSTPELTGFYQGPVYGTNIVTGDLIVLKGNAEMIAAGFQPSAVSLCVNGKKKQYKGYTWTRIMKDKIDGNS